MSLRLCLILQFGGASFVALFIVAMFSKRGASLFSLFFLVSAHSCYAHKLSHIRINPTKKIQLQRKQIVKSSTVINF